MDRACARFSGGESNIRSQLNAIERWRSVWTSHTASQTLPSDLAALQSLWDDAREKLHSCFRYSNPPASQFRKVFQCLLRITANQRGRPYCLYLRHQLGGKSGGCYQQAVESGADLIIGPLTKSLVNQLAEKEDLPVPTLALNYADSVGESPQNLYQFGLAPADEIYQILNLAWARNYRRAALMHQKRLIMIVCGRLSQQIGRIGAGRLFRSPRMARPMITVA